MSGELKSMVMCPWLRLLQGSHKTTLFQSDSWMEATTLTIWGAMWVGTLGSDATTPSVKQMKGTTSVKIMKRCAKRSF